MIRLLSVPHSGTRFLCDVFDRAGLKRAWQHETGDPEKTKEGDYVQVHFDGQYANPITYSGSGPVVIAQRSRLKVFHSWRNRQKDLGDLVRFWEEMEQYLEEHDDVFVLNVDDPLRRDNQLQAISERIGLPLEADFDVRVGHNQ